MKIFILTEGSKIYGLGHVSRMVSLYDALTINDFQVKIVVDGDTSVNSIIGNRNFSIFNWKKFINHINLKDAKAIVIDSYSASKEIYEKISFYKKVNVYFDDFNRIEYPRGIVVNGTLYAQELDYPQKNDNIYLLGPKYLPLRKEFWEIPKKEIKKEIKEILIMFGGDDIRNVTPQIISYMVKKFPFYSYKVVIGKAFKEENVKKILFLVKNLRNVDIIMFPSGDDIVKLMLKADIGIVAAGLMTLYEAMCVGLPIITITTMENQIDVLERVKKTGFIEDVGWYNDKNLFNKIKEKILKLQLEEIRINKHQIGKALINGKGALRIAEYIKKKIEE